MRSLGYIGLGKMGINQILRLKESKISVIAFNRSVPGRTAAKKKKIDVVDSLEELVGKLKPPRTIWLMISSSGVDETLDSLLHLLSAGDTIIDGGNCYYKDTIRRHELLRKKGVRMLDAGISGGPSGARNGACIMVGGSKEDFNRYISLFRALAAPRALQHAGSSGAGHFVKMVHNGIEYGMMQAIAEGFEVLKSSKYRLNLEKIAGLYNNRSVIESRLVGWLEKAYKEYGDELSESSSEVAHTGEGEWTIKTAKELGVDVAVIKDSFKFRLNSKKNPRYAGKVLSALRNQFGGHKM